jgi:protein-disulfide isomerase
VPGPNNDGVEKESMGSRSSFAGLVVIVFLSLCTFWVALSVAPAHAQQNTGKTAVTDEQRLIQNAKEAVMKELREGDFLREQIQLGIQDYINKQKEAQLAARAEEERIANEKVKKVRRVSSPRDHIFGDPHAPVSLIEYSDFECPFCKRFHPTAKEIVSAYAGKVNWVYRHFPLEMHNPGAQKQAEASECANELGGNEAFWKYADAIYSRTQSNGQGFPLTQLVPLAVELGLDASRFQQCLASEKYQGRVKEDIDEGVQIGVSGTPANILLHNQTGQSILKPGAQPLEAMKLEIDKMLNKKTPATPPSS